MSRIDRSGPPGGHRPAGPPSVQEQDRTATVGQGGVDDAVAQRRLEQDQEKKAVGAGWARVDQAFDQAALRQEQNKDQGDWRENLGRRAEGSAPSQAGGHAHIEDERLRLARDLHDHPGPRPVLQSDNSGRGAGGAHRELAKLGFHELAEQVERARDQGWQELERRMARAHLDPQRDPNTPNGVG